MAGWVEVWGAASPLQDTRVRPPARLLTRSPPCGPPRPAWRRRRWRSAAAAPAPAPAWSRRTCCVRWAWRRTWCGALCRAVPRCAALRCAVLCRPPLAPCVLRAAKARRCACNGGRQPCDLGLAAPAPHASLTVPILSPCPQQAHTSIRFGIGRFTTEAEVDRAVELTVQHVNKVRFARFTRRGCLRVRVLGCLVRLRSGGQGQPYRA